MSVPGRGEITAPALLLTTTGRKSGEKFIFPLFYGTDGDSYFVIASKARDELRALHDQDVTPAEAREIDRLYNELMSSGGGTHHTGIARMR
jgi:hypothetical protein